MNPATTSGIMGGTVSYASWLAGWSDPAPEGPTLPRRTRVDGYCKCCGWTVGHWAGCPGSTTNTRTGATIGVEQERSPSVILGDDERASRALGGAL